MRKVVNDSLQAPLPFLSLTVVDKTYDALLHVQDQNVVSSMFTEFNSRRTQISKQAI